MTIDHSQNVRARALGAYLDALSSGAPTPGGGSAAGVAGALGCSLGEMVCRLTMNSNDMPQLAELAATFSAMSDDLLRLAQQDEQVFATYRAAMELPRSTEAEKSARRAGIERALVDAAETPLSVVEIGIAALDALRLAAEIGTRHALGDLMTGGFLIQAMALGSLENVAANAASMKVEENRIRFEHAARSAHDDIATGLAALELAVQARRS